MTRIRVKRLQELIRQRVAMVLLRDLNDPRVRLVTISRVRLSADLSHCKIYWSSLEEGGARRAIAHGLQDARGFVQREVAAIMHTRTTPFLEFVFDPALEGVERLSRLLREARAEDDERARQRDGDDPAPEGNPADASPGSSGPPP